MLRTLGTIIGITAVATLITESIVFAFYWNQGTLNSQSMQDIRLILQGIDPSENELLVEEEVNETDSPSHQEVDMQRMERVVGLHTQSNIFTTIGENLRDEAQRIEEEKKTLEQIRANLQKELDALMAQNTSTEVERARGVLKSLKPDALKVEHLMTLGLEDCVILLKEMDNKEIAKILAQFSDPNNQVDVQERGKEIFQQIYQGEPLNSLAEKTRTATQTE